MYETLCMAGLKSTIIYFEHFENNKTIPLIKDGHGVVSRG